VSVNLALPRSTAALGSLRRAMQAHRATVFSCALFIPICFARHCLSAALAGRQEASQAASARQLQNAALMQPPPSHSQPQQLAPQHRLQQNQQQTGVGSRPPLAGTYPCAASSDGTSAYVSLLRSRI